jgi:hypothetical protein
MYYVTYRNVLRPGKSLEEYRQGLSRVWPTLKEWGATHAEMYQDLYDESGAFFTRYTIQSLDKWNEHMTSPAFGTMLHHLEHVLDLSLSEVTVAVAIPGGDY